MVNKKYLKSNTTNFKILEAITSQISEKKNDPKTPEIVFFGLILDNFFHLKILPKTYPPISEHTQRIIIQ